MPPATIERVPETAGGINRIASADKLQWLAKEAHRQIDFLRRHQDNGKSPRTALIGRIASTIATVTIGCDLPAGYTDDTDPRAAGALDALRSDLDELRSGDYPFVEPAPELPRVPSGRLTVAEFKASSRVVRLFSEVLGEEVLFAGDAAVFENPEGLIVYCAAELETFLGCTPDRLRELHDIKRMFQDGALQNLQTLREEKPSCLPVTECGDDA